MSVSDTELMEKIVQIAASIASSMGLDRNVFEERFALEVRKVQFGVLCTNRRHTYTLEFLRALSEKPTECEGTSVDMPKVGTENPRHTSSSPYPSSTITHNSNVHNSHDTHHVHSTYNPHVTYPHNTKGKYKPRGIDVENGKENVMIPSRDIVRSQNTIAPTPPVTREARESIRGENAWVPTKSKKAEDDPTKIKLNKIRSDLNKISPDNEDVISDRICEGLTEECIAEIIPTFFDKGVWEQKYREIYARLCVKLSEKFPTTFIPALLKHCQHEFEIRASEDDEDDVVMQIMKRRIGAIHFIVEMLKVKLLKPDIVLLCIDKILKIAENDEKSEHDEHDICHASELIIIATPIIKNKGVLAKLQNSIDLIKELHEHQFLSQRSKFKIEDAVKVYNMHK